MDLGGFSKKETDARQDTANRGVFQACQNQRPLNFNKLYDW
jgi:hypothetical protein